MKRVRSVEVPDDIKVEELTDYEMRQLKELKLKRGSIAKLITMMIEFARKNWREFVKFKK